ncbi:hypothetical protein ABZT17_12160 [Streptomyces sp. NPDC005648]|uniref:hypothetical protein n=1 Tax=Streptomyces sp. NPDC005648 TaxID=3157044 RepID=UPI0033A2E539
MICTLCTTTQLEHGTLCPACTRDTLDRLQRLPRMWLSLEAWLTPGSNGPAQYGGRARMAEAPMPLVQEVLDLRAAGGIVGVLEDWRDAVHHTRGLPIPARVGSLWHRLAHAAGELEEQIYFIALWEQGGELGRELRRLVDRVRAVVQPGRALDEPPAPTFLGYCVAADPDGIVCGTKLFADMTRPVQCTWCLCPYPPDSWLALRQLQPGRPQPAGPEVGEREPTAA